MSTWKCTCLVCEWECEDEVNAQTQAEAKQKFIEEQHCTDLVKQDEVRAERVD